MPVQVLEAEDADMDRLIEVASLAFQRNEPMWDLMWPLHWETSGRKQAADRMREIRKSSPHAKYMKAVDADSGVIIGMAKWIIYSNNTLPGKSEVKHVNYWNDEEEMAFASIMAKLFLEERNAAIRKSGGNLVCLDVLAIDPEYQRRGVGVALVRWGTDKADELGVEAVVESSVYGKGLYEKNGFVFVKDVEVKSPFKGKDRSGGKFAWLVRPKKGGR
ncbi:Uu.00g006210.m01.CDS01 [Anthostomella pinea]|uniref:Uu.00g006210.m01.CDS01 n=1 Tax=Anthostomella pinea TaxID=933095 RepID=A0AAI8VL90_9PEZI|nr:Uu.00g006210.m01.CDS01 [Anthostomella pinea]